MSGHRPDVHTDANSSNRSYQTMRQHDQRRSPCLGALMFGTGVRKALPDAALGDPYLLLDDVGGRPQVVGEVLIGGCRGG